MKPQTVKFIMMWFLPLIVIGGLFVPLLGYLVVGMMAFFLTLSLFRGRYWCWHLCPRGAFLDIVMPRFSLKRAVPKIFTRQAFRWTIFAVLMSFIVFRLLRTGGNLIAIGGVFVGVCILTTAVAIVLAIFTRQRGWCMICPMGLLQEALGKAGHGWHKK